MAFATKFKTTIQNWDGDTITAEIQEDGFAGTVQEFTPIGGSPITIEHQCNVNIKESYIVPSKATVSVYVNYEWDLVELLYATNNQYKVLIKNGTVQQFVGWIVAGIQREDYTTGRYIVDITATDGLSDLKNMPFLNSGAKYTEQATILTILQTALAKTGLSLQITENCDIYGSGMTAPSTTVSPLNQAYINYASYGQSVDDVDSAYTVLEKVLQALHCRVFQSADFDTDDDAVWFIQKLDTIGDASVVLRRWNATGATINDNFTTSGPLTMGTDVQHVNGKAAISIQEAFSDVNLTTDRGIDKNLLDFSVFEDDDFNTASDLKNWDAPVESGDINADWAEATVAKETVGDDVVVDLTGFNLDGPRGGTVANNGGTIRVTDATHSLTTSDWILVNTEAYRGIWKVKATTATTFDINATYDSGTTSLIYTEYTTATMIEYTEEATFSDGVNVVDNLSQYVQVDIDYLIHNPTVVGIDIVVLLMGYQDSTPTIKTLDSDGNWHDVTANDECQVIIETVTETNYGSGSISVRGDMDTFFTSGNARFRIGIFSFDTGGSSVKYLKLKSAKVSFHSGANETESTAINSDYVLSKDITFYHPDGDDTENEEFKYCHPIYDDGTAHTFYNDWTQGATNGNLQDIIRGNIAAMYGDNSQIWSGTLKGVIYISLYHAIEDPLNFDRVFQIQRISRNLVNDFNSLSMIEIDPAGEPVFSLSISAPSNKEVPKGLDNTDTQTVTITNTGNAAVFLDCVLSGGDTSHFELLGITSFEIPVGKSQSLMFRAVSGDADGGYASNIVVSETRAYRTMTSKTIEIGHLNTNSSIQIINNVSDAQIISIVGGVTVNTNRTGSTPNPTSKVITGIFGQSINWQVGCTQTGPAGTGGTMRLSTGGPIVESRTLSNPSNLSVNIVPDLHSYIVSGAWNGTAPLTYTLV